MTAIDKVKEVFSSKKSVPLLACILCIGVILILISNPKSNENKKQSEESNSQISNIDVKENELSQKYIKEELTEILSKVSGVGEVDVLITYASTGENLALKDEDNQGSEKTVMQTESSNSQPYIYKRLYPEIEGVIIVAQGGDAVSVKSAITDAVSAVLKIPIHKVKVLKMK